MIVAFETKQLRTECESQLAAERKFGYDVAQSIRMCIADLTAAETATELHDLISLPQTGDVRVPLAHGYQLRFCASGPSRAKGDGTTDWARVNRIKVLSIEKPHD